MSISEMKKIQVFCYFNVVTYRCRLAASPLVLGSVGRHPASFPDNDQNPTTFYDRCMMGSPKRLNSGGLRRGVAVYTSAASPFSKIAFSFAFSPR